MNTTPELLKALSENLASLSELILNLIEEEKAEEPKPAIEIFEVRSKLAEYSQAGFTSEIRALLRKFGAAKLSEVDPKDYEALLAEAEKLND